MKKILFTICVVVIAPFCSLAQSGGLFSLNQTANGTITLPPLLDLRVTALNNTGIQFEGAKDFANGKHVSSQYQLKVLSNIPWYISVRASDPMLTPLTPTTPRDIPVTIVRLKPSSSNSYINLTTAPQTIVISENSNLENTYYIDMKFDPTWTLPGGSYNIPLEFTLSPQ